MPSHMHRCAGCHLLGAVLAELGLRCVALHSHKSQKRRLAALHTFRAGESTAGGAHWVSPYPIPGFHQICSMLHGSTVQANFMCRTACVFLY